MDTRSLLFFSLSSLIDTIIIVSEKNSIGFTSKTKRNISLSDEIKKMNPIPSAQNVH